MFELFLDGNYKSEDDCKYIIPCGNKPGVLYELCKVHKGATANDKVWL